MLRCIIIIFFIIIVTDSRVYYRHGRRLVRTHSRPIYVVENKPSKFFNPTDNTFKCDLYKCTTDAHCEANWQCCYEISCGHKICKQIPNGATVTPTISQMDGGTTAAKTELTEEEIISDNYITTFITDTNTPFMTSEEFTTTTDVTTTPNAASSTATDTTVTITVDAATTTAFSTDDVTNTKATTISTDDTHFPTIPATTTPVTTSKLHDTFTTVAVTNSESENTTTATQTTTLATNDTFVSTVTAITTSVTTSKLHDTFTTVVVTNTESQNATAATETTTLTTNGTFFPTVTAVTTSKLHDTSTTVGVTNTEPENSSTAATQTTTLATNGTFFPTVTASITPVTTSEPLDNFTTGIVINTEFNGPIASTSTQTTTSATDETSVSTVVSVTTNTSGVTSLLPDILGLTVDGSGSGDNGGNDDDVSEDENENKVVEHIGDENEIIIKDDFTFDGPDVDVIEFVDTSTTTKTVNTVEWLVPTTTEAVVSQYAEIIPEIISIENRKRVALPQDDVYVTAESTVGSEFISSIENDPLNSATTTVTFTPKHSETVINDISDKGSGDKGGAVNSYDDDDSDDDDDGDYFGSGDKINTKHDKKDVSMKDINILNMLSTKIQNNTHNIDSKEKSDKMDVSKENVNIDPFLNKTENNTTIDRKENSDVSKESDKEINGIISPKILNYVSYEDYYVIVDGYDYPADSNDNVDINEENDKNS